LNAGYQVNSTPTNLSYNININLNSNQVAMIKNISAGPSATLSKFFFTKKLKSMLSGACLQSYQSGERISTTITARAGCTYATKTKHTFGLDFSWLRRSSALETSPSFSEVRAGLTYNYSFSN
jgi:hypothetical protein